MSVMRKVVTLLRGSAREVGESVVNANAMCIYEQEIVDSRRSVSEARTSLMAVMAKEIQSVREIERLKVEMDRFETLALDALGKSQEALAEEVAAKVADLEQDLDERTKEHAAYTAQVQKLKDLIKSAEARLREHEREVVMAKTTESVYRATRSISDSIGNSGSKLVTARESLERIKRRHEELADRMQAADLLEKELGGKALESRLVAAGIGVEGSRTKEVLARIRALQTRESGDNKVE